MALFLPDEWIAEYQHEGSSEIPRGQIISALAASRRDLNGYVGQSAVSATAGTLAVNHTDKDDAIRYAQGLLTLAKLLPVINKIRNGAIPVREQDGTADGANIYESFSKETLARIAYLKAEAEQSLATYIEMTAVAVEERNLLFTESTLKYF